MKVMHTTIAAKDVVRLHTSIFELHITYIYALWYLHSFLILLLQISVIKIYYVLYIQGMCINTQICGAVRRDQT